MIDYRTCEAEEFLSDESFRQWVLGVSPEATAFWEQWLDQNADRIGVVNQARELARSLQNFYRDNVTDERLNQEVNRLMDQISEQRQAPVVPLLSQSWWRWSAAASVALLISASAWFYFRHSTPVSSNAYKQLTQAAQVPLLEKINSEDKPLNVLLSDGSVVTLGKKSRVSYPKHFDESSRTVYLSGEAFFDVVKNPAKPFLIYANTTVTKVLGTSFLVRAYQQEMDVKVEVKTGRVSVYAQGDYEQAQRNGIRIIRGVVLTPNQQMTYHLATDHLEKTLVEHPAALLTERLNREQAFDNTPVSKVFAAIERTYGVKLLYDEEALAKCSVNLTFTDENLLERLDVICQTISASYEVVDGQIVITSKGCR